ncbi:hypothetical protein EPN18_04510 [bacterium]|nr:MAG: hypothetical protein EPN18_04510 [bacterium]
MSKARKKIDRADSNQLDLFAVIERLSQEATPLSTKAGAFNIDVRLRALLSDALKRSPLSREVIAGKMSELLAVEITKSQLDSWSAESKENHRFPFAYAAAFCEATGDVEVLRLVAELTGCYLLKGEDALFTELGRIEKLKEELAKKERLVRHTLEELSANRQARK